MLIVIMLNIVMLNVVTSLTGLFGRDDLAYFKGAQLLKKKSFITMAPEPNVIKLFTAIIYKFS